MELNGKLYQLKTLCIEDVSDNYVQWLSTPEVVEFLEIKYQTWTKQEAIEYVESFTDQQNKYLFGIYDEELHIGNATLYDINLHTGTFNLGLLIGDNNYWGKGVANDACAQLFEFAFNQLKLRKFFGGAYSNQLASRIVLKQLGCIEEAKLKDKFMHKGKLVDQVIYSLTNEQWQQNKNNYI